MSFTFHVTLLSSAALLGYFRDDFITYFAHPALPSKVQDEAPTSSNPHIHYSGPSSIIDPAMNPAQAGSQYDVRILQFHFIHIAFMFLRDILIILTFSRFFLILVIFATDSL